MLSMQRPLPSMLIVTPWSFRALMKSSLVNWLPWSVLNISGRSQRASASSSAATQKSAPSVFDTRHASTARLTQSMINHQVEKALGHRDVGNVGAPHLIDPLDREPAQQVRIDLVRAAGLLIFGRS